MSTSSNFPFSVAQQKAMISANLHSTLIYQFLFGIYTGVLPATIYIYFHKDNRSRARDTIIIGSITALYLLTVLNYVVNWLYTNIVFAQHFGTRVEMFIETVNQGVEVLSLVWEVVLQILTTTWVACSGDRVLIDKKPGFKNTQTSGISNHISAAALVSGTITSLVATVVICRQIWQHTSHSSQSRAHYKTIISALIESSTLYTVSVLFAAILEFTNTGKIEDPISFEDLLLENYATQVAQIMAGLAPTLMIGRLVLSSAQHATEASSVHLPSQLISYALHANPTNMSADVEMQQSGSMGVDDRKRDGIQVRLLVTAPWEHRYEKSLGPVLVDEGEVGTQYGWGVRGVELLFSQSGTGKPDLQRDAIEYTKEKAIQTRGQDN
ncbi:hypothetical protein CPC08DRAFT_727396 [Agrocybe pediades]|nr:hypothetical protein CPC08DRAFT_727396 [Agrocybe pediades]